MNRKTGAGDTIMQILTSILLAPFALRRESRRVPSSIQKKSTDRSPTAAVGLPLVLVGQGRDGTELTTAILGLRGQDIAHDQA